MYGQQELMSQCNFQITNEETEKMAAGLIYCLFVSDPNRKRKKRMEIKSLSRNSNPIGTLQDGKKLLYVVWAT